jgi:hypothetical protein
VQAANGVACRRAVGTGKGQWAQVHDANVVRQILCSTRQNRQHTIGKTQRLAAGRMRPAAKRALSSVLAMQTMGWPGREKQTSKPEAMSQTRMVPSLDAETMFLSKNMQDTADERASTNQHS